MVTTRRALPVLFLISLSGILVGCASDSEDDAGSSADRVTAGAGRVESLFVPISNYETSTSKTAKVATLKLRSSSEAVAVKRCHQYLIAGRDIIVCRDDKTEIVMDGKYGDDFTRWARVRFSDGSAPEWFNCDKVSERSLSKETYGSVTGHQCTPQASNTDADKLGAAVDVDPTLNDSPTSSVYLPTIWAKKPAETWASWSAKLAKAAPDGEYVGYGRTSSKKCKVKVKTTDGKTEVKIVSLDESGAEGRLNASVQLDETSVYGGFRQDDVMQEVASASRKASVLIVSSETETTTKDYYSRNLRVVRYPETPASVDAGQSAIFVNENYCQRLSPAIPAW